MVLLIAFVLVVMLNTITFINIYVPGDDNDIHLNSS